jgi:hypothetical protein
LHASIAKVVISTQQSLSQNCSLLVRLQLASRHELSVCRLVVFLVGMSYATGLQTSSREMSAGAKLGFHAPTLRMPPGKYEGDDLVEAYSAGIESIGKKLLSIARYKPWSDPRPLMKPALLNEMMMVRGSSFFLIDTVRRAAEFEIQIIERMELNDIDVEDAFDACENAVAAVTDNASAEQLFKWIIGETIVDPKANLFLFKNYKGRKCEVSKQPHGIDVTFDLGFGSVNIILPEWASNPGNLTLLTLLDPAFKLNRRSYLRKLVAPEWCSTIRSGAGRTGLPLVAIPGIKLESGRHRPASDLAGAQRRRDRMLTARSSPGPVVDSRETNAASYRPDICRASRLASFRSRVPRDFAGSSLLPP